MPVQTQVQRFVQEDFADFSNRRRERFIALLEGEFSGMKYQAMWTIIRHPEFDGEKVDLIDCYAASKTEAKQKLKDFRKQDGKGHRCVVQKFLRIETPDEVVRCS